MTEERQGLSEEARATMEKINRNCQAIAQNYFIDTDFDRVGDVEVEPWKILMSSFSYMGRKNVVELGDWGGGKTTLAQIISAVYSGLPMDLFAALQLQGHPDQTKDTMMSRLDVHETIAKGEKVVWQPTVLLPSVTLDEFNWLPAGKMSTVQEWIREGMIEAYGEVWDGGDQGGESGLKIPFTATVNYNGDGSYNMPPKMWDRFDISMELGQTEAMYDELVEDAQRNFRRDLCDRQMTMEILRTLNDKGKTPEERVKYLVGLTEKFGGERWPGLGMEYITREEMDSLYREINGIPLGKDANTFLKVLADELNFTRAHGFNRRHDPREATDQDKVYAYSKVMGGISQRGRDAIKFYARALAAYLGDSEVRMEHLNGTRVIVDTLAHRLAFTPHFEGKYTRARMSGERKEADLTRRVVFGDGTASERGVKGNYDDIADQVKLVDAYFIRGELGSSDMEKLMRIRDEPQNHPFLVNAQKYLKRALR